MLAGGLDQAAVCTVLGLSFKTLRKHFRREIDVAALEANAAVIQSLHRMATKGGNVTAMIWWTKSRMRWTEKVIVAGEGDFGFGAMLAVLEARRQKLPDVP